MKAAVILLADTDRPEGTGRLANALTTSIRSLIASGHQVISF
jgi:hypothetical protein